ncbi:MAG: PA2169 family four-helix-bundle protein [Caldilineaceae bacterium]|nr:PA2169 family four-helix-bundle protein [Caldilineaceae bacterium]
MTIHSSSPIIPLDPQEAALFADLLEANRDSQEGYETAATAMTNPEYTTLLQQYAQQRKEIADELGDLLEASGHAPQTNGSLTSLLHQAWLNLEAMLTQGDAPMFAECQRSDELLLAAYQDVLGQLTREDRLTILRRQFTTIRDAYERVKLLRGALEQAQK